MKVIKRDGSEQTFDREKVYFAIEGAMRDVGEIDYEVLEEVTDEVEDYVLQLEHIPTVEEIQDIVEDELMYSGAMSVAKTYIKYRHEKNIMRSTQKSYKFLDNSFLSKYKHLPEPFEFDIGKVTYYRTYSRPVPEENRRETWWETVARVVEFSSDLEYQALMRANKTVSVIEIEDLKSTAREMYEMMFNLKLFPSGRTLWVGGTPISYENPISNFNCSFVTIDSLKKFSEMQLVLMLGTGVGLSVENKYVDLLPKVNTSIEVIHKQYNHNENHKEHTELVNLNDGILKISIGDSRFGWSKAIDMFFEILTSKQYSDVTTLIMEYDYIRPYGARIKTFGGTASGHEALQKIFHKISMLFQYDGKNKWAKIRPIDALDIATAIAEGVVAGGTRRSALIVFCDPTDIAVLEAKQGLFKQNDKGEWITDKSISHRSLSNNTVFYEERPTKEQLKKQFELIRYAGEPSFGNLKEMRRRREDVQGGNPCFEILLRDRGTCNLTEVNMMGFVDKDGNVDYDGLKRAQKLSATIGYRMATIELELHEWDLVNKEDMLTGCSLTGQMDFINASGMSMDEYGDLLADLRLFAHEVTDELSIRFKTNPPKLVTAVKPSGTISLLPTVSSGVHYSHSPYYVRRIRINSADPLSKALVKSGFDWSPENGETVEAHQTKVFAFPVKAPEGRTKYDVSAIEQLELYKMIMDKYVDHNASNTVHVRDHEWEEVSDWVYDNWEVVVGITFLSLSDSFYQLMPFESLSKEQYDIMVANTPKFNSGAIREFENFELEFELEADCEGGACPVR